MRKIIILTTAAAAVAIAVVAVGINLDTGSPHAFTDNDCFSCHFTIPREGDTEPPRFVDSMGNLCLKCHDMSKTVSHQVDMVPSAGIAVPKDMPLDENGRMTCVTCHDVHRPYKNPLTGERTFFLRRDVVGKMFCLSCHNTEESLASIRLASAEPSSLTVVTPVSHRPVMDRGHGFAKFEVLDPGTALDPLSLACLDCHGEPGDARKTTLGAGIWRHAKEGVGLSHPIGVDYHRATMDYKDLVREGDLDKRIKLFDGRLGCCTCHDPYAPADGEGLVIGTKGGFQDLCFGCHIK